MANFWICDGETSINLDLAALRTTGLDFQEKNPVQTSAEPFSGFEYGFKVVRPKKTKTALHLSGAGNAVTLDNYKKGAVPHQGKFNLKAVGIPIGITASDFSLGYDPERAKGGFYIAANVTILGKTVLFDAYPVVLDFDPTGLTMHIAEFKLSLSEELGSVLELRVGRPVSGTVVGSGSSRLICSPLTD